MEIEKAVPLFIKVKQLHPILFLENIAAEKICIPFSYKDLFLPAGPAIKTIAFHSVRIKPCRQTYSTAMNNRVALFRMHYHNCFKTIREKYINITYSRNTNPFSKKELSVIICIP